MTYQRAMVLHDIVSRYKNAPVDFAAPGDFDLRVLSCLDPAQCDRGAIMYCFDSLTERALFTVCDDPVSVLAAPLLYEAQFAQARRIVTVPFEMLDAFASAGAARPGFVFSIGRCGSTLLSSMLSAIGVASVSEPDALSQLAQLLAAAPHGMAPGFLPLVVRACVGSLRRHCGDRFVIKLRSQCNYVAADIVRAMPGAQCIFMLRADRVAWARSRSLAFGEDPALLAQSLASGIGTYHALAMAGCAPHLIWYEDVRADPARVLRELGFTVDASGVAALGASLARDSQKGTHLARGSVPGLQMAADAVAAFNAAWARVRPQALIDRYGLHHMG